MNAELSVRGCILVVVSVGVFSNLGLVLSNKLSLPNCGGAGGGGGNEFTIPFPITYLLAPNSFGFTWVFPPLEWRQALDT